MIEKLSSAAAFIEGGIQDASDDSCSICLESFCNNNPSTVTDCKHEFHLQCILEWCQRSSQCPMCWQSITLKDPASQELLEVVERERSVRVNRPWSTSALFRHRIVGDFELQHGASQAELEEHIIQHLATAAAMGRSRHLALRRDSRHRSATSTQSHVLLFPATSSNDNLPPRLPRPTPPSSPSPEPELAGPSDLQSFSESIKSRLNAASSRYKETISRSTRSWKERFFSRGSEINNGISTVSRIINHLDLSEAAPQPGDAAPSSAEGPSAARALLSETSK